MDRLFSWFSLKPPVNRILKDQDLRHDITIYGDRNLYPQEMNLIMLRSPLVKRAVRILSDFIKGKGFDTNNEAIVNDRGQNINDILWNVSDDLAEYEGFSVMLSLNGLGTVESIEYIPFEFVRFGLPDPMGRHTDVKISNNWQEASNELPQGSLLEAQSFPIYNPLLAQERAIAGASNQVLYFTGKNPDEYPLVSFDAITNAAESDASIQQFELNSIANGFHGLTLFKYFGTIDSESERLRITETIKEATGVGGNGIFLVEVDEDTPTMLENVASNNTDSLYLNTITHVQNTVTINYGVPGVLLGISTGGSVFNEQALIDSFVIYNEFTENIRTGVERIFNTFGDFGKIQPKSVGEEDEPEPETEETEETTETETTDTEENIMKLMKVKLL